MATFEINEKEYELKLTYKAIKYLNDQYEGGSHEVIGRAVQGDFDLFPKIVYAGLFHTDEKFTLKKIEDRIEELVDNEELTLEDITKICNDVTTKSFFYKPTVKKLAKQFPELNEIIELD